LYHEGLQQMHPMTTWSTNKQHSRGKKKPTKNCDVFGSDITQHQGLNKKYNLNVFSNFNN